MTDKMEQIEAKIKGTVEDTTDTIKRGLDVKYQVSEHPWAALGAAVLAGYALGSMGGSSSSSSSSTPSTYRYRGDYQHNDFRSSSEPMRYYGPNNQSSDWHASQSSDWHASQSTPSYSSPSSSKDDSSYRSHDDRSHQHSSSNGFFDKVMGELGIEMDTLKTAAISSLVHLVRDTVKQNLPGVYQEAERLRQGSQSSSSGSSASSPSYSSTGSSSGSDSQMNRSYSGSSPSSSSSSYGTSSSSGLYPSNGSGSYDARTGMGTSQGSTGNSGEGEFYRNADITEGQTPRYDRTDEIYPPGSSESDRDPSTSTQREVGRNPNYDMIPPSPHANPDGRP
jgi:hypothetical protein